MFDDLPRTIGEQLVSDALMEEMMRRGDIGRPGLGRQIDLALDRAELAIAGLSRWVEAASSVKEDSAMVTSGSSMIAVCRCVGPFFYRVMTIRSLLTR